MINLTTKRLPKDLIKICNEAVKYYDDTFISNDARENINDITIKFGKMNGSELAYTDYEEDEDNEPFGEYTIIINSKFKDMQIHTFLRTIFHELTHINQIASGRLRLNVQYRLGNRKLFNGVKFDGNKHFTNTSEYIKFPWEIEAYGIETTALLGFIDTKSEEYQIETPEVQLNGRISRSWEKAKKISMLRSLMNQLLSIRLEKQQLAALRRLFISA